jgi:hypothetical protein
VLVFFHEYYRQMCRMTWRDWQIDGRKVKQL